VVAWRASTTCSDWRRTWAVVEWLSLGEEGELAVLGWVVCGGFFLRTEVRADVSLVACCMLLRLSRLRRVPVRLITWTGEGGEVAVVAVAVIEDARVAVVVVAAAAAVVLASALGDDIWRHGTRAALSLSPRLAAMLAITANQCVGPGGNGAVMQQVIMCLSKEDEVRQVVGWV
jgi:hypothetical protein